MKEEWAKDLVAWPWCISQVVKAHEDCPELQAVLDEYHKPVVIQDQVLGELKLDKDYDTFEGEIQWCGKDVLLSLEVNAESKPSWTRARSAAKKLLADCETWDKAMRELAAKNLTELANNWLSQDEENPRNPETDPITEEEFARRIRDIQAVYPYLVYIEDGEVLGYAYAHRFQERAAYQWGAELSVYLDRGCVSHGIGSQLYTLLLELLRLQNVRTAYALVTLPNTKSEALHRHFGFKLCGVWHSSGFKNGRWYDMGSFEKQLLPYDSSPAQIGRAHV